MAKSADKRRERGRFSARRKRDAVLRLIRGKKDLDALSREIGVKASTLSRWQDQFLEGGVEGLKTRQRRDTRDEEIRRLKAKVGNLVMDKELLEIRCRRMGVDPSFVLRRRRG